MEGGADISKVIAAIMQNPELITEIKNLMGNSSQVAQTEPSQKSEEASVRLPDISEETNDTRPTESTQGEDLSKKRRRELMRALKPYVSKERSQAIDSMLSIVEVFSIIREK